MAKKAPQLSRYERVKEILDKASGSSQADYQGWHQFWRLPTEQWLKVVIYGVPMIAPLTPPVDYNPYMPDAPAGSAPAKPVAQPTVTTGASCCHTPGGGDGGGGNVTPGRGEQSGLIKALKGEFPFDGTQFPPFMWGGTRVSPADIQFIAQWIDDGMPESDTPPNDAQKALSVRMGEEAHPVVNSGSTNTAKGEAGQLKQRKDAECLSDEEVGKLRYAIAEIKKLNAFPLDKRNFNNWGRLHGNECPHGWEQFLPWHRMMLYEFEKGLQDIVPDVMLSYWDWPSPIYRNGRCLKPEEVKFPKSIKAQIPAEYVGGVIPTPLKCYLNKTAIDGLIKLGVPSNISELDGFQYNYGGELYWAVQQLIGKSKADLYRKAIMDACAAANPLWHEVRYPGLFFDPTGKQLSVEQAFTHHYPVTDDYERMYNVNDWRTFGGGPLYDESFGVLDYEPHNTIHIWSGGDNPDYFVGKQQNAPQTGDMLANLTTTYDPLFYFHHSNVDRVWAVWQDKHPGQKAFDMDNRLNGLPYTIGDSWNMRKLGYEYVRDSAYFNTGQVGSMRMLRSGKANIHPKAMQRHDRVTLKLHKVVPPVHSFGVRIFVNQPDANQHTATDGNPHYAGFFTFFGHGNCVGGPGHCDMPKTPGKFDQRPLNHNREGNYRFDISPAVKRLLAKGHKDIEVKLVTMGADHLAIDQLLRMEGMTINFH